MSVKQISVFVQSEPGHLVRVLEAFEQANVSVRGYSASETADFGIVRFIVDKPDEAISVLQGLGCAAAISDVLCIKLTDNPGELRRVIGILSDCDVNVVYSYSLISTYIAAYVDDVASAEKILSEQPVEMISQSDLA